MTRRQPLSHLRDTASFRRKPGSEAPRSVTLIVCEGETEHRYHGSVTLDPARVGRDASHIADEVIAHFDGQVEANVRVTLEIEASLPDGAMDQLIRTVTENGRSLKFTSHGFEED